MNPLVGYFPANQVQSGMMNSQQPGLMGSQQSSSSGLMSAVPSLQGSPGDWSKVAYQMAGSPIQGPYPTAPSLPMPAGVTNGTQSSLGSSIGGTALGLLGALAKNPSLLKSAGNAISGLMGSGTAGLPADAAAAINSSAAAGLEPVGVDSVSELPSVSAAVDAGADAAGSAAGSGISGGLLGASIPSAAQAGASLGAGAPGVFATGNAAAGTGTAATGASLGPAATAAEIAAPFLFQQAGMMLGDAWTGKNTQGNAAMKGWMQATGAKWTPNYTNSGQNTFGTNNGLLNASSNPGTMYDKSGNVITPAQAAADIYNWAIANHVNPGDFQPS